MAHIDRNEAIRRIRTALKRRTGKTWSVTGGRGTAWGWITVDVQPKERTWHYVATEDKDPMNGLPVYRYVNQPEREFGTMPESAMQELADLFGLERPVHHQGLSISPDQREWYVDRAENVPSTVNAGE